MRSDKYIEEDLKKEKRIKAIVLLTVTILPAAVVHRLDTDKMIMMANYYESLLDESNQSAYLQGYFDGLYGVENKYFEYTDSKGEGIVSMIPNEPQKESVKKLVLKKNINETV